MAEPKLNFADGVLINGMTYLITGLIMDPPDEAVWLEAVGDVLPHVTRDRKFIDDLATAAAKMVVSAASGNRRSPDYTRARYEAARALGECCRWRAAMAYDAFQQQGVAHVG